MLLLFILFIIGLFGLFYYFVILKALRNVVQNQLGCDERFVVRTEDEIALPLYRYYSANASRTYPVIVCHGMGVNAFHWDNGGTLSFPRFLSDAGFDVWSVDLRGCGKATAAPFFFPDRRFNFDHYIQFDLPAVIDKVLDVTGATSVHWVGHSLGGIVLYAYCALNGSKDFASAVVLASSATFRDWIPESQYKYWQVLSKIVKILPVLPLASLSRFFFPLIPSVFRCRLLPRALFGIVDFNNMDNVQAMNFLYNSISDLPRGLLSQTINWVLSGNFTDISGTVDYTKGAANITFPLFVAASAGDVSIPEKSIKAGYEQCKSNVKEYFRLKPSPIEPALLAHGDMIHSGASYSELFPHIREWLIRVDNLAKQEDSD